MKNILEISIIAFLAIGGFIIGFNHNVEISEEDYQYTARNMMAIPPLRPLVNSAIQDDIITKKEFKVIKSSTKRYNKQILRQLSELK